MREIPALLKSRCRLMGICFCLALLCSCVTAPDRLADDSIRPTLPADAPINKGAGRGDYLFVTLRLESGEELLMLVDTGCERTMFDKSLEPKLGKRRGTRSLWYGYLGPRRVGLYRAPKLYLGNTPLLTGDLVATDDLRWMTPGRPTAGVLGTDCLRHYCIQLDFASGRMRFLDPDHVKAEDLGKAFLLRRFLGQVITRADLFGRRAYFALDSADPGDGVLKSKLFRRELRQQNAVLTNRVAWFAKGALAGETYTNLMLSKCPLGIWLGHQNLIGLRFLARHLVTFNFPKRTMYLQRTSVGPLVDEPGSTNALGSTLAWWETEGLPPSGNDNETLAARLVSAPNLRPAKPDAFSKVFSWDPPRFISVGPPSAKLRVVHMPPGDYRMKVVSKAERKAGGGGELKFGGVPETNTAPTLPVQKRRTIVLLHDYNYQKEPMVLWAWVLAQTGYDVILPDLRGHGESTGQTVSYGKYETADLRQLLDSLTEQWACDENVGVLGVGYGASLALHWAALDPRVRTVVAIAPYNQPEQAFARMSKGNATSISPEVLEEAIALAAARLNIQWANWSGEATLRQLKQPVLLIGAGKDAICTTNDFHALEQMAPAGSKSLLIPEADHQVIGYWFHEIAEPVKAWFAEHLPTAHDGENAERQTTPRALLKSKP